jgi:hypothetical protein
MSWAFAALMRLERQQAAIRLIQSRSLPGRVHHCVHKSRGRIEKASIADI